MCTDPQVLAQHSSPLTAEGVLGGQRPLLLGEPKLVERVSAPAAAAAAAAAASGAASDGGGAGGGAKAKVAGGFGGRSGRPDEYRESPLDRFRACRVLRQYLTHHRRPYDSLTWSHAIDPSLPLCAFDLRGKCVDAECPQQHASDYQLSRAALLEQLLQLGGDPNRRPLGMSVQLPPGLSAEQSEAAHYALTAGGKMALAQRPRRLPPPRLRRRQRTLHQEVPEYTLSSASAGGSAGSADSSSRPFRTVLLAPANLLAMCSPEDGQPVDASYLSAGGLVSEWVNRAESDGAADGRVGRYFGADDERSRRSAQVESLSVAVQANDRDVGHWLALAMARVDFSPRTASAVDFEDALKTLARGLETVGASLPLFLVYVRMLARAPPPTDSQPVDQTLTQVRGVMPAILNTAGAAGARMITKNRAFPNPPFVFASGPRATRLSLPHPSLLKLTTHARRAPPSPPPFPQMSPTCGTH